MSKNLKPTDKSWMDWRFPSLPKDPSHPAQIALRTYALALSLSFGPSLLPFVLALFSSLKNVKGSSAKTDLATLKRVLRRELGHDGFAFSLTLSVAGGAAIRNLFQNADVYDHQLDANTGVERYDSSGSRITGLGSRGVQRLLQPLKGCLLNASAEQQTFISNIISSFTGMLLLQAGRARTARLRAASKPTNQSSARLDRTSPTLDLTLLLLVRAVDSVVQTFILQKSQSIAGYVNDTPSLTDQPVSKQEDSSHGIVPLETGQQHPEARLVHDKLAKEASKKDTHKIKLKLTSRLDAFVFWACSARIMWCFFYEPHRLPKSYVKWIRTLANVDDALVQTLQLVRAGTWSYRTGSPQHGHILQKSAQKLGHPASWGDPSVIPAYGGAISNAVWESIGVHSRPGVGGLPCEVVHGKTGTKLGLQQSCTANAGLRVLKAFLEALMIYLPVHLLPVVLTRRQILLRPHRVLETLLGAFRSATFLSFFIGLYWYSVCFTRTVVLAKLFPFISHDFWDGPFGCVMAGCLMCGSSIWIEDGRRRGEMALYVLPRALRACLPDTWVKSGNRGVKVVERISFILSMSVLLTAATHRPDSLRGLSRWTLAFVTNGPNAGFWKRRRRDPSIPPTPTPSIPPTPLIIPEIYDRRSDTPKFDI